MSYTIRDVRTHEKLVETEYSQKSSAKRSFLSRLYTPDRAYIADENWREREACRPNLINLEQFGLVNRPDHFLHVSAKSTFEDFLISYTESEIKGRMDRQSPGRKVGRYLKEFYPELGSERINTLTHEITAAVNKIPVHWASTSKEISSVYEECGRTSGMTSCMTHPRRHWGATDESGKFVHPTEAYGGGDLQLAYLRNDAGHISARVMVWPEKKFFNRFYGPDSIKLKSLLETAGYVYGSFHGAKLSMIRSPANDYRKSHIAYIAPYTDIQRYVYMENDQLYIGAGEDNEHSYAETNTGGFIRVINMVDAVTGEKLIRHAQEVRHPYSGEVVYVDRNQLDNRAVVYRGSYYARVDYPTSDQDNGSWVKIDGVDGFVPYWYANRNYHRSAYSGKFVATEHTIITGDGYVSISEFIEHYERCEMTGVAERRERMREMPHGKFWCRTAVDNYAVRRGGRYESRYHVSPPPPMENVA